MIIDQQIKLHFYLLLLVNARDFSFHKYINCHSLCSIYCHRQCVVLGYCAKTQRWTQRCPFLSDPLHFRPFYSLSMSFHITCYFVNKPYVGKLHSKYSVTSLLQLHTNSQYLQVELCTKEIHFRINKKITLLCCSFSFSFILKICTAFTSAYIFICEIAFKSRLA